MSFARLTYRKSLRDIEACTRSVARQTDASNEIDSNRQCDNIASSRAQRTYQFYDLCAACQSHSKQSSLKTFVV
jgi:hypothetical protein